MREKYKKWLIATAAAGAAVALLDALWFEKYFFQVKRIPIGNLKAQHKLMRILLLSDLHLNQYLTSKHFKLAEKIHQLKPDIILITGDSVDQHGNKNVLSEFLDLLDIRIPKAAIMGNHDHKAKVSTQELKQIYAQHNGTLLLNQSKAYTIHNNRLMITGLDDFIKGESDFTRAVAHVGKEKNHFLLVHSPLQGEAVKEEIIKINASRREEEKLQIQYIFAGHNHGGQVTLFGLFAPYLPKKSGDYLKGWYNKEKPYLYLSKGFGTSTVPFRFAARAEITLFYYYT